MNNTTYAPTSHAPRTNHNVKPNVQQHPAQQAVESVISQFEDEHVITVRFEKDEASMNLFKRPNSVSVAFICGIYENGVCISQGRGVSFISYQTGKYVEKAILYARNSSFIDSISRASRLSTMFASDDREGFIDKNQEGGYYQAPETKPSEKQIKYLKNLIETLPGDEQTELLNKLPQMNRHDVSELINDLKN